MGNSLLPDPKILHLESIIATGETITIAVMTTQPQAVCPCCDQFSRRVHSRYTRTITDLPWQGIAVRFRLTTRKFFCQNSQCDRRIFTEPLPLVVRRYARKTVRLADALRELTYLVGGEAASRIAAAFGLHISSDTLLRHLKRAPLAAAPTPHVLGVDDFAFRKGRRYGTILVDLERHCPVDLLPNREPETFAAWLKEHPGVAVISRDRGNAYIEGATTGAPNAVQVADRWHLIKNLGDALERLFTRSHRLLREIARQEQQARQVEPPNRVSHPPPLKQQQHQQARREKQLARFAEVKRLLSEELSQRAVARRTGLARKTVRRIAQCESLPDIVVPESRRRSRIDRFVPYIKERWKDGYSNATLLHREIVAQGFTGSVNIVQRLVQPWRDKRYGRAGPVPVTAPSPRRAAWLLTGGEDARPSQEERAFMKRLLDNNPTLVETQAIARSFAQMIRERNVDAFPMWLERVNGCISPELKGFARSLQQDRKAAEAALSLSWSNGQVEGQVNRLKFLKRQMYGRAGFDLLKARVLPLQKVA